jgi:hypothetical protein
MVVDPFSIAGAVGLAAGLVGFMASTIERTSNTIDTAKHTSNRLKIHDLSLRTCQQRLKEWARQWHGRLGRTTENDLRFLWGGDGFEEIESRKQRILEEQASLHQLLYGRQWFERRALEEWRITLQSQEQAILRGQFPLPQPKTNGRHLNVYRQLATALWDNNLIAGGVDRLRRLIDDLEITSQLYYHHQQQTSGPRQQPSREDVRSVLRLRARAQRLSVALTSAHHDLVRADAEWALLSTVFDDPKLCQLDANDQLSVTFLKVCALSFYLYQHEELHGSAPNFTC